MLVYCLILYHCYFHFFGFPVGLFDFSLITNHRRTTRYGLRVISQFNQLMYFYFVSLINICKLLLRLHLQYFDCVLRQVELVKISPLREWTTILSAQLWGCVLISLICSFILFFLNFCSFCILSYLFFVVHDLSKLSFVCHNYDICLLCCGM